VVLLIVAVLVIVKVTSSSSASSTPDSKFVETSAQIVNDVTNIPASVYDKVGITSSLTPIQPPIVTKNQPPLTLAGKPGILYIGGEFCPYCAAQRWAIAAAMSRFGKWANIGDMQSSSSDIFPNTQTFTFAKATYQSPYLTFQPVEHFSNVPDPATGYYKILQKLTAAQQALESKYDGPSFVGQQAAGGIPFMDVGNKVLFAGPSYSPSILTGLTREQIAANLDDPSNGVTQAIVASANYISASACAITNQQPADVCTSKGVTEAASAMKLGT
jgi:hypothetical protein